MRGTVLLWWAILVTVGTSQVWSLRTKRRVVFPKGGKLFVRLNIKENLFPSTTLFAFAYGFKLSYDLPSDVRHSPYQRRAIYGDFETLINQHDLDGRACVLRALCEAAQFSPRGGIFQRALHLVFSVPDSERDTLGPYYVPDNCDVLVDDCPFSFLHAVPLDT